MIQNISVMSLLKTAYCKHLRRNSKGKCSPFEVGVLCLTMALIPQGVVTIQNVNFHAFMLTCEDELEDKRRHVSTSISSERPSGPQEASQVATLLHTSFEFIASFLWAPPVATQFSVLS